MGDVYLATDITAGRKAALKLLPTRFTGDAERLKRFQQEARAVVGLNHPNILTIYEIGEDHSIHYIASELIEGETLRQRLDRGRMQLSEALDVAIQVASALAAAHEAGIIHRDIKPENIMLRPDGYVKVLDFGIAKLAEQEVPVTTPRDEALLLVETNLGSILGTVRYMSPEQACGAQVDKSTDIWSLGVVLYEMVTGHAPFTGDTPREVMSSILEKEPPPLTSYIAHTPAELQQIIGKTLRKDRKERYRSAHELLEALKDLRRKLEFESFFKNGFFDEVKRRKVYRVAAAYIIVAAGIIQLASAAFPAWDLPNWALRLVIVLLLIGFPLALILGWAFDVTSQGIRVTPGAHRRRNVIMLVAAGVIISAAAGFFLLPRVSPNKLDKSIAVLPFENLSKDEENAVFAGGVQREVLSDLAKVNDLKVISRTSVMSYKAGAVRNLKDIARELGVSHVVEGTVQRVGERVRVTAQLIDARTDSHIWAETYDRELADVFAIQSEIAQRITDQLGVHLSSRERADLTKKPTQNVEAYELYTRARALMDTAPNEYFAHEENLTKAVGLLEQAVAKDQQFSLAYSALAEANIQLYNGQDPKVLDRANAALQEAHRLAPEAGETHFAQALFYYYGSKDFDRALATLEVAAQSLPNNAQILALRGLLERRMGRWEESLRHFKRAIELDPKDHNIYGHAASVAMALRRYEEAHRLLDAAIAAFPTEADVYRAWKSLVALKEGDAKAAREQLEKIRKKGDELSVMVGFAVPFFERNYAEAEEAMKDFVKAKHPEGSFEFLARLAVATNTVEKRRASLMAALARNTELIGKEAGDSGNLENNALLNAALGNKEEAIRVAKRAVELYPVNKDALNGPSPLYNAGYDLCMDG